MRWIMKVFTNLLIRNIEKELTNEFIISATVSLEKHSSIVDCLKGKECLMIWIWYNKFSLDQSGVGNRTPVTEIYYLFKTLSSSGWTVTENSSIAAFTALASPEFKLTKRFSRSDSFWCKKKEEKFIIKQWLQNQSVQCFIIEFKLVLRTCIKTSRKKIITKSEKSPQEGQSVWPIQLQPIPYQ